MEIAKSALTSEETRGLRVDKQRVSSKDIFSSAFQTQKHLLQSQKHLIHHAESSEKHAFTQIPCHPIGYSQCQSAEAFVRFEEI